MPNSGQNDPGKENRNDPRQGQTSGRRYQFRQKMISIGSHYWIENEQGEQVYKVDGKIGMQKKFDIENTHGQKLAKVRKLMFTVKETMEIDGPDGEPLAVVKKDLFTPLKEHFVVEVNNGTDLDVHGNLLDYGYKIDAGNKTVAEVSKKFFHVRDSYSVWIAPGQDDVILLAVVLCIDVMAHAGS